ncbi:MAG: response regulator [Kofleriaceae bacterium]
MGTVLIVESDPQTSTDWIEALGERGHAVVAASQMREALPFVKDGGIDAIVLDVDEPRSGLVELARSIAALPDAPPVVLVSGSPYAPQISARIGAAAFIPSPCSASDVVAAVARLLGELRPVLHLEDEPITMIRR